MWSFPHRLFHRMPAIADLRLSEKVEQALPYLPNLAIVVQMTIPSERYLSAGSGLILYLIQPIKDGLFTFIEFRICDLAGL